MQTSPHGYAMVKAVVMKNLTVGYRFSSGRSMYNTRELWQKGVSGCGGGLTPEVEWSSLVQELHEMVFYMIQSIVSRHEIDY